MKYLATGLLLLLLAPVAQALTLEEWQAHQARTPAFMSHIEKSRWLVEQEMRVHTSGRLIFLPDQSMVWQWLSPLQAILELDATGQFLLLTPSEQEVTIDPQASEDGLPGTQQLSRLVLAALHGDTGTLKEDYHLILSGNLDQWRLALLPRQVGSDIPKLLTLRGGHFIETLDATSSSGNTMELRLIDHTLLVNHGAARLFQGSLPSPDATNDDATSDSDTARSEADQAGNR